MENLIFERHTITVKPRTLKANWTILPTIDILPKKMPLYHVVNTQVDNLPAPPAGHSVVDVYPEIEVWIKETQPVHSWKYHDVPAYSMVMTRIYVSDYLLTLIKLKYS